MMASRREVLRGRLFHRQRKGSWKKRLVVVYCGHTQSEKQQTAAQILLFEDYENQKAAEKSNHKPKRSIDLSKAKIEASSGVSNSSTGGSPQNLTSRSPALSPPQSVGGGNDHMFAVTGQSDAHEFRTETENEKLRWVKLLGLLTMFPFSVIPEEPKLNPIKQSLRAKQDPSWYGADSVWTVYILPEEVGSRCHIIGTNVVALTSGVPSKSVGKLDIINPADPHEPIVSWDRDKMRRTGKTGNLVFIEIGRRCEGGPGLVWMYAGFDEAQALRETLHKFLFRGDGKAVDIPTQPEYRIYDVPRPSYDSTFPPSYQNRGSYPNGHYQVPRRHSTDQDSGNPASPQSFGTSPQLDGPPVRLDKHPSIRRKGYDIVRSSARRVPSISGQSRDGDSSNASFESGSLDEGIVMFGEGQSRSVTPPDEETDYSSFQDTDSVAGTMDPDSTCEFGMPKRCYSEPCAQNGLVTPRRHHTTGSCDRSEYERMVHPYAGMYDTDGYVLMRPKEVRAQIAQQGSVPIPFQRSMSADSQQQQRHSPSNRDLYLSSSSPRKSTLPTITERRNAPRQEGQSNYENFPLPPAMKNASPVYYHPTYENISLAQDGRRGSLSREQYENVTLSGEQIRTDPRCLQKRASLRRQRSNASESESAANARVPLPPKNGMSYGYAEIYHGKPSDHVHNAVKDVHYSKLDYQSASQKLQSLHLEQHRHNCA